MATDPATMIWEPAPAQAGRSRMGRFLTGHGFSSYADLWTWSVGAGTRGAFWQDVAELAGVRWARAPDAVVVDDPDRVPGVRWFPGGRLNYAERALRSPPGGNSTVAVVALSQTRDRIEITWDELAGLVDRVRTGLVRAGVRSGDRVAGYVPNVPEAVAAMLAAASMGAIWTCCSAEMGVAGVLDRLTQVEPAVLIGVDGYRYGERAVDRRSECEELRRSLPSLRCAVWLPYLDPEAPAPSGWTAWDELCASEGPADFTGVEFDHPIYILFSSGTTGRPKPIVHGHGGILLEHAKALALHFDLGSDDRFLWYTTTGWMMWNFLVSGLVVDATIVLFDGNPAWPRPGFLWDLSAREELSCLGVGSAYLVSCMRQGMTPGRDFDLSRLRALGATGSPLPAEAARWAYEHVTEDMMLGSFSGGTDVCTGFVGPSPVHPVWAGEISCRCLGADVEVFDEAGRSVVGQEGELVLSAPLPSMPVSFWGDPNGDRYRTTYFERFPGVWAHGDRATLTDRGTVTITGRSDGTLNRGGVRMGTAEFYSLVEGLDGIADSLVVHVEDPSGGPGELWLFLVAGPDPVDEESLTDEVRAQVRRQLSARHVPDHVVFVPAVPRTLTGKKMEVPIKRLLAGAEPDRALAVEAVAEPESLAPFLALREGRFPAPGG